MEKTSASKRLFSKRYASMSGDNKYTYDDDAYDAYEDPDDHTPKRSRPNEWPLKNATTPSRPSRFQEGSMRDRVSQMPPPLFMEVDMNRKIATPRATIPTSETSKHSSILKLGKSLASGLNPANWKLWGGKLQADNRTDQQKVWDIQKERVDKAYDELMESGYYPVTHQSLRFSPKGAGQPVNKHDSGISFDAESFADIPESAARGRTLRRSTEGKRLTKASVERDRPKTARETSDTSRTSRGRPPVSHNNSYNNIENVGRAPSPLSDHSAILDHTDSRTATPTRNTFLRKKRPSFSDVKKAFNESTTSLVGNVSNSVKRISSRKDLAKLQKKLSKSEFRTEELRRQVAEALADPGSNVSGGTSPPPVPPKFDPPTHAPAPGPARFVPTMPSLPSERLLADYVESSPASEGYSSPIATPVEKIGRAVTMEEALAKKDPVSPIPQAMKEPGNTARLVISMTSTRHVASQTSFNPDAKDEPTSLILQPATEAGLRSQRTTSHRITPQQPRMPDVPPLPPMPKTITLANGEVVKIDQQETSKGGGLTRDTESFVWDRDTF